MATPSGLVLQFGHGTTASNSLDNALRRVEVAFEIFTKLQAPFYAFHDRDVAPEGSSLAESHKNFDRIAKSLKEHQDATGVKLLWGTANLFSNHVSCMVQRPAVT